MSHRFYDGEIFHKRFIPTEHKFTYPFFMLDIDVQNLSTLHNSLFTSKGLNLFAFKAKDHFGTSDDFFKNIEELLKKFDLKATPQMRFITLPRIFNFVFNPISTLILFNKNTPTTLLAEVHNYNGGRVVYEVKLEQTGEGNFRGEVQKNMYVSPFLKRDGRYVFTLSYNEQKLVLSIVLYQDGVKTLVASLSAQSREFSAKQILKLFCKHSFLTFGVVTRTLWQSFLLKRKGMQFSSPQPSDTLRRT